MKSPIHPEIEMKTLDRFGITIEYCPKSGGVWLDKGELEKIIQMTSQEVQSENMAPDLDAAPIRRGNYNNSRREYDDDYYDDDYHKRHKKKSMIGEIFDIF